MPVFLTLKSDFSQLSSCGKFTYGPVGVQSNSRKRNENIITVIYREDPKVSGVMSWTESLPCIFFSTSLLRCLLPHVQLSASVTNGKDV